LLLAGAGLLVRSFVGLQHVDPGVRDGQLLTMSLSLPESRSLDDTYLRSFFEQVIERVKALPGVEAAVSARTGPRGGGMSRHFAIDGSAPPRSLADVPRSRLARERTIAAGARYAAREGRLFGEQDDEGSPRVAVVNQALVRRFFPGKDPIGRQILLEAPEAVLAPDQLPPSGRWARWTVVGIVGDVRYRGSPIRRRPWPTCLSPAHETDAVGAVVPDRAVLARRRLGPGAVHSPHRRGSGCRRGRGWSHEPRRADARLARPSRVNAAVMGVFAASALLLASWACTAFSRTP